MRERLILELDDRLQYRLRPMGRHERRPSRWPLLVDVCAGLALALVLRHLAA